MKLAESDSDNLPALIRRYDAVVVFQPSEEERALVAQAGRLFKDGYFDHALLDLWNATVFNIRRRIEAYGVELFLSVVKDEPGKKKYHADGETIQERWYGVDDAILLVGAQRLGLINKKANKTLETINWMRSHASAAHLSETKVEQEDVVAFALLLQKNIFESPFPEPGHSVSSLFDPAKTGTIDDSNVDLYCDQVRALRRPDVKTAFGFMLDLICQGVSPGYENSAKLFPVVWEQADDDTRKIAGMKLHSYLANKDSDTSPDKRARTRILELLVAVKGIQHVPDASRARIYRRAARRLAAAKDKIYGWKAEEAAAKSLAQFGPYVPSIAFEEVYQEILTVWCGNYWGRSQAHAFLKPFIENLRADQIREIARMFGSNERVRHELSQSKPKAQATALLNQLKDKLVLQAHINEIDEAISAIKKAE
jgi:hypothetical protein